MIKISDIYNSCYTKSLDEYIQGNHNWCWCLVGNIIESHEYGEEHKIKYGTKQFRGGTKVYLAPIQWGDGYENIVVIGLPRHSRKYIEVITRFNYIKNLRIQRVFKPSIIKIMCQSEYRWWGDSEEDHNEILKYLK